MCACVCVWGGGVEGGDQRNINTQNITLLSLAPGLGFIRLQ